MLSNSISGSLHLLSRIVVQSGEDLFLFFDLRGFPMKRAQMGVRIFETGFATEWNDRDATFGIWEPVCKETSGPKLARFVAH